MCDDCNHEIKEVKAEESKAPDFDVFEENGNNDEIGLQIIASIEKIAQGVMTLRQEIVLLGERVEAHEAHLSFLLLKDPAFLDFLKKNEGKMKEAVAAQETPAKE